MDTIIEKIISETPLTQNQKEYVKVVMDVDYLGNKERITKWFLRDNWEEIKVQKKFLS